MSSSPPFTLFNLPYVPLSIILNTMNEIELIKVALTSKKVYKLSKMLRKKQMENIHVCIGGDYPSISLGTKSRRTDYLFRVFNLSEIQEDSRIEYLKIGDTVVQTQKSKDERGCIYFYYEDHFIGTQILSEIVSDFFSVPIYRLSVTGDKNINDPRRAIDWIMSRQNSIGRCSMNSSEMSDEDLKRFLDGFIVTDELTLSMKTSDDFQYSFKYPMNQQTISSHQYPWLTMNNLLEINPSHLEMRETKFTNEEMNLFIRNWINGGNSNLRSLAFRLNNLNLETILNGIPSVLRTAPGSMPYNWCPLSSFYSLFSVLPPELITFCFDQFFEIRNVNGVVASIVVERVANDDFILLTWPDYKGQPYPVELIV